MRQKKKMHTLKVNFLRDEGGTDVLECVVLTPAGMSAEEVEERLEEYHEAFLEDGFYDRYGKNAWNLVDMACSEEGWTWAEMEFDMEMEVDA